MRVSFVLFLFIYLFSLSAYGYYGSKANYKWWKNPNIVSEMGLTREQANKIEKIFSSKKEKILKLQRQLTNKEIELKKKLRKTDSNNEEVLELLEEIEGIKASLTRIKVQMFLRVKSVLTPEQIEILYSIKSRYRGTHR